MRDDYVHNHSDGQGCAHTAVPGDREIHILAIQQREVGWYIKLRDLGIHDEDQERSVDEVEEEDLGHALSLLLGLVLVALEFTSPDKNHDDDFIDDLNDSSCDKGHGGVESKGSEPLSALLLLVWENNVCHPQAHKLQLVEAVASKKPHLPLLRE
jgi:hypothetical protein